MVDRVDEADVSPAWALAAAATAVFVIGAVVLEIVSGVNANSPVPDWAELAPVTWPAGARVVWWLAVATAAAVFRVSLHRLGLRQRWWVVIASVGPFALFAAGIAMGAEWATWH